MDAFHYQELLQCIKRQENEIAQLRQACMGSQQELGGPTITSRYSHDDNNLPAKSGRKSGLSLEATNTKSQRDPRRREQNIQIMGTRGNRQQFDRQNTRLDSDYSSPSSDGKSTSDSDSDIRSQPRSGQGHCGVSDDRRHPSRRRDRTYRRHRSREKSA